VCEFLSAWLNIETEEIVCADAQSHEATQEHMGWRAADLEPWREWEWTGPGDDALTIRLMHDDPHDTNWYRALVLARYPTWQDAINDCCRQAVERTHVLDCSNCPALTALPDLPACERLDCYGCSALTALPDLPACEKLDCSNCPALTALPDLPACERLDCYCCSVLTALPDLPACETLYCHRCSALTALPDLPACERLDCYDCSALTSLPHLPACEKLYCNKSLRATKQMA
jgi:hypothetical protein